LYVKGGQRDGHRPCLAASEPLYSAVGQQISLSLWLFVIWLGKLVLLLWHAVTPVVRQDRRTDIIITGIIIVWLRGTRGVVWRHRRP